MELRRIGLLGDIHAEVERLATALTTLERRGVDATLAVGDIVDGAGDVDACLRLLEGARVAAVRGNHERWLASDTLRDLPDATPRADVSAKGHAYLESLPATRRFSTSRGELLLCHGTDDDDMAGVGPDDAGYALATNFALQRLRADGRTRFVVAGHTHRRMVRALPPLVLINAGTLKREHDPCFGLWDLTAGTVTFFDLVTATTAVAGPPVPVPLLEGTR